MKNIFKKSNILSSIILRSGKYTMCLFAILIGMLVGLFVLFPLHEIASYYDKGLMLQMSPFEYLINRFVAVFSGNVSLIITEYWTLIGALMGMLFFYIFRTIHKNATMIRKLSTELEKSFPVLLAQGESNNLEFKSSLRWDYKEEKINKNLENVIIKTLAAFLNSEGGTLLIGVDDAGNVIGLEKDYENLKHKNRDGFEQAIMSLISAKLGAATCSFIMVMFHSHDSKDACRILAMPSSRPIYVSDGTTTKFYMRTGCTTRELNLQEAVDYISLRWGR